MIAKKWINKSSGAARHVAFGEEKENYCILKWKLFQEVNKENRQIPIFKSNLVLKPISLFTV